MKRHQIARAGQVILSEIWGKKGAIGFVPSEGEGALCTSHFFLFDVDESRLSRGWLQAIFSANYLEPQLEAHAFGTTGYASVRPRDLLSLTIPLPPVAEQRRIVSDLDRLAAMLFRVATVRQKIDADLSALRRAIYSRAEVMARSQGKAVCLSDLVLSHGSGWSPQCEDFPAPPSDWGVLKTTCVQWDGFDPGANKALRAEMQPRPELTVREGDILVTRAGPMNRVGVACVVPSDQPRLMLSDKIVRLTVPAKMDPGFIVAMLGAPSSQEYLRQNKTGLAKSQVNISRARLLDVTMPMPPLATQRRISEFLLRSLASLAMCEKIRGRSARSTDALWRSALSQALQ